MTSSSPALPRWDMSVVFPGLDSPELEQALAQAPADIAALAFLFDQHHVDAQPAEPLTAETVESFNTVLAAYSALMERVATLGAYISAFVSTDTRDALAQARQSTLQTASIPLRQLGTRLTAWLGSLDIEALIAQSPLAADHAFMLRQAKIRAEHLMSPAEESLATELGVPGGGAWGRLHSNLSSQITVPIVLDGREQRLPMSSIRNLAHDPSAGVRRTAYEAELTAWERHALPLAAALNSIKGEVNILSRRRGWESPLAAALFWNNIDRATLDAMTTAARESFPDFRRYLRAKAKLLGNTTLPWYDLFAPVGQAGRSWSYDQATAFVVEQFDRFSPRLGAFARRAFRERWVDAEPRDGKVDGAFCMRLRNDESRVLLNFQPGLNSVMTLAHELGHGYHNINLATRAFLNRTAPMTVAETASTFNETIIRQAALEHAGPEEQLEILQTYLEGACQVVVDISSRFIFESNVFAAREKRELSIEELNQLMLDSQRETYGDGLDQAVLHPYMWAVKSHYYSTGLSFYNFPYMFGLLFGLGLFAFYRRDPDAFRAGYDDLLSSTGLADAATLAERMGIDIRSIDFWRASLDTVREDIDRFISLT